MNLKHLLSIATLLPVPDQIDERCKKAGLAYAGRHDVDGDLLGMIDDDVMGWGGRTGGRLHEVGQAIAAAAQPLAAAVTQLRDVAQACMQPGQIQRWPARPEHGGGFMTKRPAWRGGQYAPGVQQPREGMVPLPFTADTNGGIFTSVFTAINFIARPQKPYRGERLFAFVTRTGASATPIQPRFANMFVGVDMQQAQAGAINVEAFGPTSFGIEFAWTASEPGIDIVLPVTLFGGALAVGDSIAVSMFCMGSWLH